MEEDISEQVQDKKQEWGLPSIGIPTEILWNPLFSYTEKALYGFLRNLSAQDKGCFATNIYLGNLVGITKNSASRTINRLKTAEYIIVNEFHDDFGSTKRTIYTNDDALKKYRPLIKLVQPMVKTKKNWQKDEEVLALSEKLTGLSRRIGGVTTGEYPDNDEEVPPESPVNINEEEKEYENEGEKTNVSKETSSVFDKTRQVDLEDVDPTVVENKEVTQTENKPLAKDSVAIPTPENINNVSPRPTPRKIEILKKETTKPTPKTPQEIQELIQFWCGLGLVQHKNPEKKVYQEASKMLQKLMKAKFFEKDSNYPKYADYKFTKQEIIDTFKEFALSATNFNYQPQAGSYKTFLGKTSLPNFLYNNKTQKSLFIQFFEEKAVLLKDSQMLVEDLDQETTVILKHLYEKKITKIKPLKYDSRDENNFRKTSNNLKLFYELNRNIVVGEFNLLGSDIGAKRKRADYLFEAIMASIGDNSELKMLITTSWLCSDKTFNERLPKYLNEQGIIR